MSGEESMLNSGTGNALPISLPSSPAPRTPWDPPETPSAKTGWWSAWILSILGGLLLASLLSPLHFTTILGKALMEGDKAKIAALVDCRLLSSCLEMEEHPLSPEDLVLIYSSSLKSRSDLEPWSLYWGEFPDVTIAGLSYRGMMHASVRLSDGIVLNLERRGLWTWRLFCAEIPR
jgi:hypothetical protein